MGEVRASPKPYSFGLGNRDLEATQLEEPTEDVNRASETFFSGGEEDGAVICVQFQDMAKTPHY